MPDAVEAAPDHYKVVEENDRVRILEFKGKKGDKTAMHSHPDVIAVAISDAKVKFGMPNGEEMELELPGGAAMFNPSFEHTTEVLSEDSHVILIELKG